MWLFLVKSRKWPGREVLRLTVSLKYFDVPGTLEETPRDAWSLDRDTAGRSDQRIERLTFTVLYVLHHSFTVLWGSSTTPFKDGSSCLHLPSAGISVLVYAGPVYAG